MDLSGALPMDPHQGIYTNPEASGISLVNASMTADQAPFVDPGSSSESEKAAVFGGKFQSLLACKQTSVAVVWRKLGS